VDVKGQRVKLSDRMKYAAMCTSLMIIIAHVMCVCEVTRLFCL